METAINLFAGGATIAGILLFRPSLEAVEDFCKFESHILLSDPLIAQKEIAMEHLIRFDRPL
jgi:hypothetical protein